MYSLAGRIYKARQLFGMLERVCQALELSPTQYEEAKSRYEAVGSWLAEADNRLLQDLVIYPQGSAALGTTVKPLGQNEHDVDLVSFAPHVTRSLAPAVLKRAIGDRLRAQGHYARILEEKPRCWRLNYANEFHLDITPSIRNSQGQDDAEFVPDRLLATWKPTNPKGYRARFEYRASLLPQLTRAAADIEAKEAEIEPFPTRMRVKGLLRRTVQLAKRHRDIYFERLDASLAPISIIITTLASQSYEQCVLAGEYETELDLLLTTLRQMPNFIEQRAVAGRVQWFIWNETTTGENFAEKWNAQPELAQAFFDWHGRVCTDLERLLETEGLDQIARRLSESFGPMPASRAMNSLTDDIARARLQGQLSISPRTGLTVGTLSGSIVRPNTFFGA